MQLNDSVDHNFIFRIEIFTTSKTQTAMELKVKKNVFAFALNLLFYY